MTPRPTVLLVTPDFPYPVVGGGNMRAASLLEALQRIARVVLVCVTADVDVPGALRTQCERWGVRLEHYRRPRAGIGARWRRRGAMLLAGHNLNYVAAEQLFVDHCVSVHNPDLIWFETPFLSRYGLKCIPRLPVLVDYWGTSEGAQRDYQFNQGWRRLWHGYRWRMAHQGEARFAPRIPWIMTVSEKDAAHFRTLAPDSRITTIPIGVTVAPASTSVESEVEGRMIMTGDLAYRPNVDAALYFVRDILPRISNVCPQAHVLFVGRCPAPALDPLRQMPHVAIQGFVPDLGVEIQRAALYVLPMRLGSGIRSKLFEVFPSGKPLVTTSTGAEGLALVHEKNCLIADSPDRFAEACVRLLQDQAERQRLGQATRRLATDLYHQDRVADQVRALVEAMMASRGAS